MSIRTIVEEIVRLVMSEPHTQAREIAWTALCGVSAVQGTTLDNIAHDARESATQAAFDRAEELGMEKTAASEYARGIGDLAFAAALATSEFLAFEFWVGGYRLDDLRARVAKMNARAKRIGCEPISIDERATEFRRKWTRRHEDGLSVFWAPESTFDPDPKGYTRTDVIEQFVLLRIIGQSPKINGYTFVAKLEHADEAGNIMSKVPGCEIEIPAKYRDAAAWCDHCKTNRFRRDTYILVRDADGEFVQIGRTCLRDFLGLHGDPERMASLASMLSEFFSYVQKISDEDFDGDRPRTSGWERLDEFLTWTAAVIRQCGWISRKAEMESGGAKMSTANQVQNVMYAKPEQLKEFGIDAPGEEDAATAQAAIAWALEERDEQSDYLWNLRVIAQREVICLTGKRNHAGLAASMVAGYNRDKAREADAKVDKANSTHQGVVGERMRGVTLTVDHVTYLQSDWGSTALYTMHDASGNVFKWFASGDPLKVGETYLVDAGVKKHDEYKGVKQTVVTRVKEVVRPVAPTPDTPDFDKAQKAYAKAVKKFAKDYPHLN